MEATIYDFINQQEAGIVKLEDTGLSFTIKLKELSSGLVNFEIDVSNNYARKIPINLKEIKDEEDLRKKAQEILPDGFSMWKNW